MYDQYYNLSAEPFRMSPDHRFCYKHTQYAKAMAYMAYAFMRGEGFVLITGSPGTGKTTLVGNLIESLADENVTVGNLVSTQLAADDLLRMTAFSFDIDVENIDKSVVLRRLTNKFTDMYNAGGRALLIVDEAQDLTATALEELRLLTNLQKDGKPLLQIFLLGQSELRDLVHDPSLEQVHQRIVAASHLEALKESETRAYVEHRLLSVGWENDPEISSAVYPVIFKFSEGIPRRINLFCSRLFLHACVERRHQICLDDAKAVVTELQEEQLSTRNLLNDDMFFAMDNFDGPLHLQPAEPENFSESNQAVEPSSELEASSVSKQSDVAEYDSVRSADDAPELGESTLSDTATTGVQPADVISIESGEVLDDLTAPEQLPDEGKSKKKPSKRRVKPKAKSKPKPEPQSATLAEAEPIHISTSTPKEVLAPSPEMSQDEQLKIDSEPHCESYESSPPEERSALLSEPDLNSDTALPIASVTGNSLSVPSGSILNLDAAVVGLAFVTAVVFVLFLME